MISNLYNWFEKNISADNDNLNDSNYTSQLPYAYYNDDINLNQNQLDEMNERIQSYLMDDSLTGEVDNTLKIIQDETQRWNWSSKYKSSINTPISATASATPKNQTKLQFASDTINNDELLVYCLKLERNNAFLLDLVDRFDDVSFHKKYKELLVANEQMSKEINRLKNTNSKVYSSYCDLIEEMKKIKLKSLTVEKEQSLFIKEIENLKDKINHLKNFNSSKDKLFEKHKEKESILEKENKHKENRIRELESSISDIQLKSQNKDELVSQLSATNVSLKLKLEKAEKILKLKGLPVDTVNKQDTGNKQKVPIPEPVNSSAALNRSQESLNKDISRILEMVNNKSPKKSSPVKRNRVNQIELSFKDKPDFLRTRENLIDFNANDIDHNLDTSSEFDVSDAFISDIESKLDDFEDTMVLLEKKFPTR